MCVAYPYPLSSVRKGKKCTAKLLSNEIIKLTIAKLPIINGEITNYRYSITKLLN